MIPALVCTRAAAAAVLGPEQGPAGVPAAATSGKGFCMSVAAVEPPVTPKNKRLLHVWATAARAPLVQALGSRHPMLMGSALRIAGCPETRPLFLVFLHVMWMIPNKLCELRCKQAGLQT